MVGVPGRSKGCATCRRRRKGCDLQRPVCGQCTTANITCDGWQRERVFVNATAGPSSASAVARYTPKAATDSPSPPEGRPVMHDSLARTAYGEKYLEQFWDVYLPEGWSLTDRTLSDYSVGTWTSIARNIYQNEPAVKEALYSHALATIGRRDGQTWMIDMSLKAYGCALVNVRAGLARGAKSDALVVASRALASYEILYGHEHDTSASGPTQAKRWHTHNLGDEGLIKARGPLEHIEGDGHRLFVDGRMQLVICACMRRKRSFLSDHEWLTTPWTLEPKTPKDALLDILAHVPALLEDIDKVSASANFEGFVPLIEACARVGAALDVWYAEHAPVAHFEALRTRKFAQPHAQDLVVAEIMGLYWSGCIMTYGTLRQALNDCPSFFVAGLSGGGGVGARSGSASSAGSGSCCSPGAEAVLTELDLSPRTDPRTYFRLVIETAPVFFQPSAKTMFVKAAAFPVGTALSFAMGSEGPDSEYVRQLIGLISSGDAASAIGRFLRSTARDFPGLNVGHF